MDWFKSVEMNENPHFIFLKSKFGKDCIAEFEKATVHTYPLPHPMKKISLG